MNAVTIVSVTEYTARYLCICIGSNFMHYCVFRRNIYSIGTFLPSLPPQPSSLAVQVVLLVLQVMIAAMRTIGTRSLQLQCSGLSYRVEKHYISLDPIFVITEVNFIFRHSIHLICSAHSVYIHFSSGGSYSYSSVGSPGSGCCTVCSHLVPAEVSFSFQ